MPESSSKPRTIAIIILHGIGHPEQPKQQSNFSESSLAKSLQIEIHPKIEELAQKTKKMFKQQVQTIHEKINPGSQGIPGMIEKLQENMKLKDENCRLVIKPIYWGEKLFKKESKLYEIIQATDLSSDKIRQIMITVMSDLVAYQPLKNQRSTYDEIHEKVKQGLHEIAKEAGPNATLCVIAHSLGSVIAFNYLSDLQAHQMEYSGDTSLEKGETLRFLYTMGSPLALYALRYEFHENDEPNQSNGVIFGKPIKVNVWKNFYDKADIIAYPLHDLNEYYKACGVEDIPVDAGSLLTNWNPISHMEYWTDPKIIDMIINDLLK